MNLLSYEHKIVRVIDVDGRAFTGIPVSYPADYGFHEFNRDEESIKMGDYQLFESDIAEIRELPDFSIIRATETWQQAGAYYVRIQAMAKKHHITLRRMFDEAIASHDPEKLRLLDEYYTSGAWREDYEADERGELPSDLKHGILSQDALYDLLEERRL